MFEGEHKGEPEEYSPWASAKLETDRLGGTPGCIYRGRAKTEVGEGRPLGIEPLEGPSMASDRNRQTISFEELAYSNMLQVQALVELLEEKGLLTRHEVLERVKQLRAEMAGKRRAR